MPPPTPSQREPFEPSARTPCSENSNGARVVVSSESRDCVPHSHSLSAQPSVLTYAGRYFIMNGYDVLSGLETAHVDFMRPLRETSGPGSWSPESSVPLGTGAVCFITGAVQFDSVWGPVLHNNLAALPLMALLGVLTGEPTELAYNVEWSQSLALSVALSCAISVGIAYSAWSVRQQVSASCFTVLGVANKLLTVLVSNLVFTERSSALGNGLLFVCVVAAALYKQAPLRPPPVDDEAEHDESASLLSLSRHDGGYSIKRRAYDSV